MSDLIEKFSVIRDWYRLLPPSIQIYTEISGKFSWMAGSRPNKLREVVCVQFKHLHDCGERGGHCISSLD